ncbi:MAG: hypothetical protein JWL98_275 [Xanthomonadaceae bacterium]|nr:hypothetical protein [Xanthomonadaceae bacterium]
MVRTSTRLLAGCAVVVLVAGCKQYQSPTTQTSAPADTGTPAPSAPAAVPDQPSQSGADLGVANSADHGKYLVDATGKTVYMLQKDSKGASSCYDACATQWPPLLSPQGTPKALDPSVAAGAIVDIQRTDGGVQVTYHGHPLYHYSQDLAAGQINGQGARDSFGEW